MYCDIGGGPIGLGGRGMPRGICRKWGLGEGSSAPTSWIGCKYGICM